MTNEIIFVLTVVTVAGALFVSGKVRLDIVALLVVLSLIFGGSLTAEEALAGFGEPVVIMVAGLFVISAMLTRTGVAHQIGNWIAHHGKGGEMRLIILLSLVVAVLGCFMSNTAVVAIFVPVVLRVASQTNLNASRLLMPLAFAGLVSGMMTLISTTPNLVVSQELVQAGFEPFGFFSFTPIGLSVLFALLIYMALWGRRLLPGDRTAPPRTASRNVQDLLEEFELLGTAYRLQVPFGSPLVGRTLTKSAIGSDYGVRVILVEHSGRLGSTMRVASPELMIRNGDVLVVHATKVGIEKITEELKLRSLPVNKLDRLRWRREIGLAKVLIHPDSKLIGTTLRESGLRLRYGVQVTAVRRNQEALKKFPDEKLSSGDTMLVVGPWKRIHQLQSALDDLVVLELPSEIKQVAPAWRRAPIAITIICVMVVLSGFNIVPVAISVLIAALMAVVTRCLTMEQAYESVQWNAVVLIAGMLSIAQAMTNSGAVELLVGHLVSGIGDAGPYFMMTALFGLTSLTSMLLSSAPTAIIFAPIAIRAADALDVSPYAFAMTVAISATAGFVMPVSSPAVMLVMGPGKYRLMDFVKAGLPLLIITGFITIALVPRLFPF